MSQSLFIEPVDSVLRAETEALTALVTGARCLVGLTGAGVSTESGIHDYRDERGEWKRTRETLEKIARGETLLNQAADRS